VSYHCLSRSTTGWRPLRARTSTQCLARALAQERSDFCSTVGVKTFSRASQGSLALTVKTSCFA
jgi:hypothetical protein